MPNRRRRKLSTAMSAVAALAVASPIAVVAVTELSASTKPAPQHREFVQASLITDLPGELLSALTQGLSQFGINVPPMPNLLTGSGSSTPATLTPGLGTTPLTAHRASTTDAGLTTARDCPTTPSAALPGATASRADRRRSDHGPDQSGPDQSASAKLLADQPDRSDPGSDDPADRHHRPGAHHADLHRACRP